MGGHALAMPVALVEEALLFLDTRDLLACCATAKTMSSASNRAWERLCTSSNFGLSSCGARLDSASIKVLAPSIESFRKLWIQCRQLRSPCFNVAPMPDSLRRHECSDAIFVEIYAPGFVTFRTFMLDVAFPQVRLPVSYGAPALVNVRAGLQIDGRLVPIFDTSTFTGTAHRRARTLRVPNDSWMTICVNLCYDGTTLQHIDVSFKADATPYPLSASPNPLSNYHDPIVTTCEAAVDKYGCGREGLLAFCEAASRLFVVSRPCAYFPVDPRTYYPRGRSRPYISVPSDSSGYAMPLLIPEPFPIA